ncbi:histidine phosphatase family protein [Verticiella sediminum]|uniref:Histidine phosphatase family protein n=1 Tax=Verticiella sediminum TaxID=1247510 RepID=A0A556AQC3_9BURK|nr:histidine phosphatase family protein [Verticiella sediminum]TSH95093.1 histidine phosphatase family protein [Verticiella sediminum]
MNLILWRHAQAEDGRHDMLRKLTPHGREQARRAGAWLRAHLPHDTRIIVSPAVRACETADALGRSYDVVQAVAPNAEAGAVLKVAGWPEAGGTVLVVGHQPTLGRVASLLMTGSDRYWSVRRAGIWWLTHPDEIEDDGTRGVVVRTVVDADLL